MTRKALLPQRPRHILVFDEDWDYLRDNYGPHSAHPCGISPAIRQIIHGYVRRLRAHEEMVEDVAREAEDIGGTRG